MTSRFMLNLQTTAYATQDTDAAATSFAPRTSKSKAAMLTTLATTGDIENGLFVQEITVIRDGEPIELCQGDVRKETSEP